MLAVHIQDVEYLIINEVQTYPSPDAVEVVFCENGNIKISFACGRVKHIQELTGLNHADLDLFYDLVHSFYVPVYNNGRFYADTKT